jgi:hypothetical protein
VNSRRSPTNLVPEPLQHNHSFQTALAYWNNIITSQIVGPSVLYRWLNKLDWWDAFPIEICSWMTDRNEVTNTIVFYRCARLSIPIIERRGLFDIAWRLSGPLTFGSLRWSPQTELTGSAPSTNTECCNRSAWFIVPRPPSRSHSNEFKSFGGIYKGSTWGRMYLQTSLPETVGEKVQPLSMTC